MKAKIFSFVLTSDDSVIASVRIAKFVSELLQIPIVAKSTAIANETLDALLIVNGAYAFAGSDVLASLGEAIEKAGRVVWIQNDYTIIPPKDESGAESPFRKAFRVRHHRGQPSVDYWTTCDTMARPGVAPTGHRLGELSTYVNWNCLTTDFREPKPWSDRQCGETMIYYGSFRKDREKYFQRYFGTPLVPMLFSCPTKKAEETFTNALVTHETKIHELYSYLGEFGMGLYLEDRKSHSEYHSPANRFYEMMSAGLPIVFQAEAQRTLEKAGYEISDYILWNADEAPKMMEQREKILEMQREQWIERIGAERRRLPEIVLDHWSKYQ